MLLSGGLWYPIVIYLTSNKLRNILYKYLKNKSILFSFRISFKKFGLNIKTNRGFWPENYLRFSKFKSIFKNWIKNCNVHEAVKNIWIKGKRVGVRNRIFRFLQTRESWNIFFLQVKIVPWPTRPHPDPSFPVIKCPYNLSSFYSFLLPFNNSSTF
jgi:hypothetical protein